MNFAPYQDQSPETERALSPPLRNSSNSPNPRSPTKTTPPRTSLNIPRPGASTSNGYAPIGSSGGNLEAGLGSSGFGHGRLDEFATSLPLRLDWEACLAYLLLPPAGGVLLLLVEHRSDYVRFHAWQSSLLFTALFVLHVIFSWSSFLSWVIFLVDLGLIGYLTYRAYVDADTLDRCEVPFFGPLASRILDDE